MLRSVVAYLVAAALLLLGTSALRQALSELRDTEPGSLLFGALQLVIGTSAVVAAIGLVKRARWAAWSIALWGVATTTLLAVQPLFEPMDPDAQRSIWWGAAAVGVAAAGVSWFASRLGRGNVSLPAPAERTPDLPPAPVLLTEAGPSAEPLDARAAEAQVSRDGSRHDERSKGSGAARDG